VPDPAQKLATAADLVALGDGRFEVVGGQIVEKAGPSYEHSDAQAGLATFLRSRFHHGGGPPGPGGWWIVTECEIELETHEVYRPDLVGWRRSRVPERPRGRPIRTRPDWVCEVLSRSNARADLVDKLRTYARAAVPHYWLVDPDDQVLTVYRHRGSTYEVALTAASGETVRAEPFEAVEISVGVLFGED
jgi:Uma2 family endonuclease